MKAFKGVFFLLVVVGWLFGAVRTNGQTYKRGEICGFVFDTSHLDCGESQSDHL
jgi:hypothetical protein